MRRWWGVLTLVPLASLAACEVFTASLGGLEVRLTVPVDTTLRGVSVPVTIVVRNSGFVPIGFSGSGSCTFGMEVSHPDGTVTGREGRACTSDLRTWTLAPGDSLVVARFPFAAEGPAGTYRLRPYVDAVEGGSRGPAVPIQVLPSARARLVHTDPWLPPLDLVVGGRRAAAAVAPGAVSDAGPAPTGRQTTEVRRAGETQYLDGKVFEFLEGSSYTFVVWRPGLIQLRLITDPDTIVSPNRSGFRLIHLAKQAPLVLLHATPPDGADPVGVAFPFDYGVAWPYVSSDPGWWRLAVTGAGGSDTLAWWSVRLRGGQVRTLLVLDGTAGGIVGLLLDP